MNRFFLPPANINQEEVHFPEDVAQQILRVLRLKTGEYVQVLDNQGSVFRVLLQIVPEEGHVSGKVVEKSQSENEPDIFINLYFALTSRDKVEFILQKGTEIGVSAFSPFVSSRTLVQSVDLSEKRRRRWERIIQEAAEQSFRGKLPVLNTPQHYKGGLISASKNHDVALIAWEGADSGNDGLWREVVALKPESMALLVGPEGGFSDDDISLAVSTGGRVVSMGKRILRMETAAIVFPAQVLFAFNEI